MENNLFNYTAVLYALGWAIAHSLWQMGILWLTFQLFFGLHKNQKPALRYAGSIFFIIGGFSWFIVTFFKQYAQYQLFNRYLEQLPVADLTGMDLTALNNSASWIDSTALFTLLEKYIPFLSAGYLIILILLSVRLINAYAFTQKLKTTGLIPAGTDLEDRLAAFVKNLRIPATVRIYFSELIDVPATIGFLKPVILLPIATVTQLSSDQVEAIILHELAHIRRRDYLLNMIVAVLETILFFNPFVHLLTVSLKKERELFCDDFVVSYNKNPQNYASALLSVEKMRRNQEMLLAVAATGHDGVLLNRVKRILNIKTSSIQYREKIIALVFISILLSTLAWIDPVPGEKKISVKPDRDALQNSGLKAAGNVEDLIKKDFPPATVPLKSVSKKVIKPSVLKQEQKSATDKEAPAFRTETTASYSYSLADVFPPATNYEKADADVHYKTLEPGQPHHFKEEYENQNFKYDLQFSRQNPADSIIKAQYLANKGKIGNKEFQVFVDNVRGMQDAGFHFSPWFLQKMTAIYRNELNNTRNIRSSRIVNGRKIPEKESADKSDVFSAPEMNQVYLVAPSFGTTAENGVRIETVKPSEPVVQLQPMLSGTVADAFLATPPVSVAGIQAGTTYARNRKISTMGPEEEEDITPVKKRIKVKAVSRTAKPGTAEVKTDDIWITGSGNTCDTTFNSNSAAPDVRVVKGYSYQYAPAVRQRVSSSVKTNDSKQTKQKITIVIETDEESINIEVDAGEKKKQVIDL